MHDDSVAVLGSGATANLVRFKWLENRNSHLQKAGIPHVSTFPTLARFKFGDGRVGGVRYIARARKLVLQGAEAPPQRLRLKGIFRRYCVREPLGR